MKKTLLSTVLMSVVCCPLTMQAQQKLPYQNPQLSAHERAVDLCGRLTLEGYQEVLLVE